MQLRLKPLAGRINIYVAATLSFEAQSTREEGDELFIKHHMSAPCRERGKRSEVGIAYAGKRRIHAPLEEGAMPTKKKSASRVSVIDAVQSSLGFFTLGVLVAEVLIGVVAATLSEPARAYLAGGMLLLLFLLVGIVSYLAAAKPDALLRRSVMEVTATAATLSIRESSVATAPSVTWLPIMLHHVSLPVSDLERSKDFYQNVLGLSPAERPDVGYQIKGAWFDIPGTSQQVHLIENKEGTFRVRPQHEVFNDCHFALRVTNVDDTFKRLMAPGRFLTDHPFVQKLRYPHLYTLDPDGHVIEINQTPPKHMQLGAKNTSTSSVVAG